MREIRSLSLGIWVTVGSRDETKELSGISHFIEHMVFKGTKKRSAEEIAKSADYLGGQLNAFTAREYTCFYARILAQHLEKAMEILADIFLNSLFAPEAIEKEKKIVIEEINMYHDTPTEFILDFFIQTLMNDYFLGHPITGSKKTVKGISQQKIIDYINTTYSPEEIIIAGAGNLTHSRLVELVKRYFSDYLRGINSKRNPLQVSLASPQNRISTIDKKLEQAHVCVGVRSYHYSHPKRYAAALLNLALGGGVSSRIFQLLREKKSLAYSTYSFLEAFKDVGALGVYAGVSPLRAGEAIELIFEELRKIKQEGITAKELERTKEQLKGCILLEIENSYSRMTRLVMGEYYFNQVHSLDEVIANIEKVTLEDILSVSQELFGKEEFVVTAIGPAVSKLRRII
jgi:predicted Zn-dependent peptidase